MKVSQSVPFCIDLMRLYTKANGQQIDMMNNSHLRWGCTGDPKNVKIDWHVPTDEEKAFALELLETFLVPSMERIDTFTSGDMAGITDKHEQTNELCRHLAVIRNALLGSASMINDDGNDEAASSDESEQMKPYSQTRSRRSLQVGYAFGDESDPRQRSRARELRKKIGELTHQAIRYFQEHREDDLESIKVIIKIARTYLDNYGSEKSCLDRQKVLYDYSRISCCLPHSHKLYPRTILGNEKSVAFFTAVDIHVLVRFSQKGIYASSATASV